MRHRRVTNHFGRKSGPRKALIRGLVDSLVEHERIKTTLPKAKELRRHVERAITKGKDATLTDVRTLASKYPNKNTVHKITSDLGPRFKDRPGGYTRIIKLGRRPGDAAEMAFIEFVDYDFEKAAEARKASTKVKVRDAARKLVEKEMTPEQLAEHNEKLKVRADAKTKKRKRKIAEASRKENWKKPQLKKGAAKAKKQRRAKKA